MGGEQEWVVKPSQVWLSLVLLLLQSTPQGGEGLTLYNPASGQCLVTDHQVGSGSHA